MRRFADMEVFVEVQENVRGEDMFVIQSTSFPANDNLMELLIMIDALRRASARRITAVIPYFGYARQDRKVGPRTPISAKLVANLITEAGANRVLTVDLHAGQIQGFFDIPTDNLFAMPVMVKDIMDYLGDNLPMVVSPDVGGVVRARALARRLGTDLAIVDKRRERAGESEVMNIIGDVEGQRLRADRRYRRFRRHHLQRRRCAAEERRHRSLCLCHPWRAVGRRGGADQEFQAQIHGGDGFHRGDRRSARLPQYPQHLHRAADRRSDAAHQQRSAASRACSTELDQRLRSTARFDRPATHDPVRAIDQRCSISLRPLKHVVDQDR